MNENQIKLFKSLISKIIDKDELICLYNSVDYDEFRELIYYYWCENIGDKEEFLEYLSNE